MSRRGVSARAWFKRRLAFIVIIIIINRFYIALFSALEQTHCTRM